MKSTQEKIMYLIKENPKITQEMMSKEIGTGDTIVVSVLVLAVAGRAIVVTIIKKNKSSKENSKF